MDLIDGEEDGAGDDAPDLVEAPLGNTVEDTPKPKIPITIITGYLGSGKSSFLRYILKWQGNQKNVRVAVILNEFGDSFDIEQAITVSTGNEHISEVVSLPNGCMCCTIKSTAVMAIESLVHQTRDNPFDIILLETSGITDPATIINMFWLDEGLNSQIYFNGLVTIVDSCNIRAELAENVDAMDDDGLTTAHRQIAFADFILINKLDQYKGAVTELEEELHTMNGTARILRTENGVPLDSSVCPTLFLSFRSFDAVPDRVYTPISSHLDPKVSTVLIPIPQLDRQQRERLDKWLQIVLWNSHLPEVIVYRLKGIVFSFSQGWEIIQGVRQTYEFTLMSPQPPPDYTKGKMVLIGKNMEDTNIEHSLMRTVFDTIE